MTAADQPESAVLTTQGQCAAQKALRFVSVIIPTYNRSRSLTTTIESLLKMDYPSDRLEIIVVDNCSTDGTKGVVEACQMQSKVPVRYVWEGRQGSHFARNTGAKHAAGDILYYTDDDMVADPEMLRHLLPVFDMGYDVASATGRILPKWEVAPPTWVLRRCHNSILGIQDRPENLIVSPDDVGVYSGHQAVLKEAFFRAGGFNPDLVAGERVGDGEAGLNRKIKNLGYRFGYVRKAVTYHVIPPSRTTQAYLNKRMFDQGDSDSYTYYRRARPRPSKLVLGLRKHFSRLLRSAFCCSVRLLLGRDSWHLDWARVYYCISRMRYDWRLARDAGWRRMSVKEDWLNGQ